MKLKEIGWTLLKKKSIFKIFAPLEPSSHPV